MKLEKDPAEYFMDYAEKYGEDQYEEEIPYLLWDVEGIAQDVKACLEAGKTLSEMFPDRYPMELGDPSMMII